jgi:hypothetical protein
MRDEFQIIAICLEIELLLPYLKGLARGWSYQRPVSWDNVSDWKLNESIPQSNLLYLDQQRQPTNARQVHDHRQYIYRVQSITARLAGTEISNKTLRAAPKLEASRRPREAELQAPRLRPTTILAVNFSATAEVHTARRVLLPSRSV